MGKKDNTIFVIANKENRERADQGQKARYWDDCGAYDSKTRSPNAVLYLYNNDGSSQFIHKVKCQYCVKKTVESKRVCHPLSPQPSAWNLLISSQF